MTLAGFFEQCEASSLEGYADRIRAGELEAIEDYIEATEPLVASRALKNFYFVLLREADADGDRRMAEEVRKAVVTIPGHAKVIGDEIREVSRFPDSARKRSHLFKVYLAGFKSDETIEEICSFLDDDSVVHEEINDGTFMAANRRLAVQALARMHLPDAPTKPEDTTGSYADAVIWKEWFERWKERKAEEAESTAVPAGAAARPPKAAGDGVVPAATTPDRSPLGWGWLLLALVLVCAAALAIRRALQ